MDNNLCLNNIAPGDLAIVTALNSKGSMRRRLLDLGLVEDTQVECVGRNPGGGLSAFLIRGAVIAIREEDCRDILVSPCGVEEAKWVLQTAQ